MKRNYTGTLASKRNRTAYRTLIELLQARPHKALEIKPEARRMLRVAEFAGDARYDAQAGCWKATDACVVNGSSWLKEN